jgi:four helix bundle protein
MNNFRELEVWEKGHELTLAVYKATARFPNEERYGLTSQIRRASVSIPANLAEGCGRGSDAKLARFSQIAAGSASKLEYHLQLANELDLLNSREHIRLTKQVTEVKRMLTSYIKKLKAES